MQSKSESGMVARPGRAARKTSVAGFAVVASAQKRFHHRSPPHSSSPGYFDKNTLQR